MISQRHWGNVKRTLKRTGVNLVNGAFGSKNYNKFVMISRGRTGSNLLKSLIESHKEIHMYGEHFRNLNGNTTEDHFKMIFPQKSITKWIGFKLFYYHPFDTDDRSIWKLIENDKSFRIIHLTRNNILRMYLSKEIAEKTGAWKKHNKGVATSDKRIVVDIEDLLTEIHKTEQSIVETREKFKDHMIIELTYEELVRDKVAVMDKVFQLLDVDPVKFDTALKKQNPESIEDLVINYNELKKALENTKYTSMLEE